MMLVLRLVSLGMLFGSLAPAAPQEKAQEPKPAPPVEKPTVPPKPRIVRTKVRPASPIRLGGVFTLGLDESADRGEAGEAGRKLSAENLRWIADNVDVAALPPGAITPETFPELRKANELFTPLLLLDASTLAEQADGRGNLGGWKPEMSAWTLRDNAGNEIPHPVTGAHWMDFGSRDWASFWRDRALELARQHRADGVVAAHLPLSNFFVGDDLGRYHTASDLKSATSDWLHAARAAGQYLLIPSASGFETLAGHATLPVGEDIVQPELSGRLWDEYYPAMDGAWAESWVHAWQDESPQPENEWEIGLEAADRAGRNGQVFIAGAAYHNAQELEYALASYLLVAHRQGRVVFQPMPLLPDERRDAGFSLAVLRRQVTAYARYFNAPLGLAQQERHLVPAEGGEVWRRAFQNGVVYVNSSDQKVCTVTLGGETERLSGLKTRQLVLPPHSGAILLYPH